MNWPSENSGRNRWTGSSKLRLPRCWSFSTAAAVNVLERDAMGKRVSVELGTESP